MMSTKHLHDIIAQEGNMSEAAAADLRKATQEPISAMCATYTDYSTLLLS